MKILPRTRKASRRDAEASQGLADAVIREIFSFPRGLRLDRTHGAFRRLADAPNIAVTVAPTMHPIRLVTQSFQNLSVAC